MVTPPDMGKLVFATRLRFKEVALRRLFDPPGPAHHG
jgi:hypothetical protein